LKLTIKLKKGIKMKKITTTLIMVFALVAITFGQDQEAQSEEHPIDVRLNACMEGITSMTIMTDCQFRAVDEWFIETNKYYNLLLDTLSETSASRLIASQEAWIEYYNKETLFIASLYYSDLGGHFLMRFINAGCTKDIVRRRALELKSSYDDIIWLGLY
jgi:uncharacterized protein YecT (DUF1311 family)